MRAISHRVAGAAVVGLAQRSVNDASVTGFGASHSQSSSREEGHGTNGNAWSWFKTGRPGWSTRTCGAAFAVAFASAVTVSAVALKAPDTPDYLLPYYLRSARSRFNHYASIREKGGVRYMTTDDFVSAMLALKDGTEVPPAAVEQLEKLFRDCDANADGRISFREFSFLSILLCTNMDDFEVAFAMFDEEQKGGLTRRQFRRMISVFGDETMKPTMRSGLVTMIFDVDANNKILGSRKPKVPAGKRRGWGQSDASDAQQKKDEASRAVATFEHFRGIIASLERDLRIAEFRTVDTTGEGKISRQAFGELLTNSILGRHLPFFIVDNMRRMDDSAASSKAVSLDSWLVFNEMMKRSDAVSEALLMYTANGMEVKREDFHRALRNAEGMPRPMTDSEVDLVFEIFDRDGDGSLEYDEFASVMRDKAAYNVIDQEKKRNNFFVQLVKCSREALLDSCDEDDEPHATKK